MKSADLPCLCERNSLVTARNFRCGNFLCRVLPLRFRVVEFAYCRSERPMTPTVGFTAGAYQILETPPGDSQPKIDTLKAMHV